MHAELSRRNAASSPNKRSGEGAASTVLQTYFDPAAPVGFIKGGNLPHWRQDGATYFVTWRTADSMPNDRVMQWLDEREEWLSMHPMPHDAKTMAEYDRLFPARWEQWLDEGYGECVLARPDISDAVAGVLRRLDGNQYRLHEFVVMPNHVHVLVTPLGQYRLSGILQAWKSVSSHAINRKIGRRPPFWQKESFDHIVRNGDQMERFRRYIKEQSAK